MSIQKIIIRWLEVVDGSIIRQTRRYKDETKADEYIQRLHNRGIEECIKTVFLSTKTNALSVKEETL